MAAGRPSIEGEIMLFAQNAGVVWEDTKGLTVAQFSLRSDVLHLLSSKRLEEGKAAGFRGRAVWYILNPKDCCLRYGAFPPTDLKTMQLVVQNTFGVSLPGNTEYVFDFRVEAVGGQKSVLAVFLLRELAKDIQRRLAEKGLSLCGFVVLPPALAGLAPDKGTLLIEAACPDASVCHVMCRDGLPRAWRVYSDSDAPRSSQQPWIEDCYTAEPRTCGHPTAVPAEGLLPEASPTVPAAVWACAGTILRKRAFPFQRFLTEDLHCRASGSEVFYAALVWAVVIALMLVNIALVYRAAANNFQTLQVEAQQAKREADFSKSLSHAIAQKRRLLEAIKSEVKQPVKLVDVLQVMGVILPRNTKITALRFSREEGLTLACIAKNREDFILLLQKMKTHPMFVAVTLVSNEETASAGAEKLFHFEIQTKLKNQSEGGGREADGDQSGR